MPRIIVNGFAYHDDSVAQGGQDLDSNFAKIANGDLSGIDVTINSLSTTGNVGIYQPAPDEILHIGNTAGPHIIKLGQTYASGFRTIHVGGAGQRLDLGNYHGNNTFVPTLSVQHRGGGGDQVGIGTTAPTLYYRLHVVGATLLAGIVHLTSSLNFGSYTVATLPTAGEIGRTAYASDARKPGEGAAAGTGVLAYDDGTAWRSVCDGTTVVA